MLSSFDKGYYHKNNENCWKKLPCPSWNYAGDGGKTNQRWMRRDNSTNLPQHVHQHPHMRSRDERRRNCPPRNSLRMRQIFARSNKIYKRTFIRNSIILTNNYDREGHIWYKILLTQTELQKAFNLPPIQCKISSFRTFLKIMWIMAFHWPHIHDKPFSRVVPAAFL